MSMTSIWEIENGRWVKVMDCRSSIANSMHTLIRKDEPHKIFKVSDTMPEPPKW